MYVECRHIKTKKLKKSQKVLKTINSRNHKSASFEGSKIEIPFNKANSF